MSKNKDLINKDTVTQAILVSDTFDDEFLPLSEDVPHALIPLVNKPIIDYTLEFLSRGGIEETFLFCCSHIEKIKQHIKKCIENKVEWTFNMKVNVIFSESCRSFGDCLRDLDAKGLLRADFVLLEAGTVSNLDLIQLLKKHNDITKTDKGCAMTVLLQETGIGYVSRCPKEELVLAATASNRVLFYKKIGNNKDKKLEFPLEIFLENPSVSIRHDLKDTHISICSSSVLPLFSDNFDFQTKDDFVRGLLMNEEILGMSVYSHILKGNKFGGAVTNWRMYQAMSTRKKNNNVVIGTNAKIDKSAKLSNVVIGNNVKIAANAVVENSFVFSNTTIEKDSQISLSIIGHNVLIKSNSKVLSGSVIGDGVILEHKSFVDDALVQRNKPDFCDDHDILGKNAYKLVLEDDEQSLDVVDAVLSKKFNRLHINTDVVDSENEHGFSDFEDDESSCRNSPGPEDDTRLFYTEVMDSLTRGYEDNLQCDNLILEVNSSRYAYNVTLKEVNFYVIRAVLCLSLKNGPISQQYFQHFAKLLNYFTPILKNYLRSEAAMIDCLQAIENVATENEELTDKWVMFVLQYFYDKDHISEEAILNWFSNLDTKSTFRNQVKPFTDWLQEAEEASSSDED